MTKNVSEQGIWEKTDIVYIPDLSLVNNKNLECFIENRIKYAISELPLATFSKRFLVLNLSYENDILLSGKLNSF